MRNLGYDEVLSAVTPRVAVDAVREVLLDGFDPATDPHRQKVTLPHGEMHLLPSALDGVVGVKVLGIQPAGSELDVPLVQGSYLLMGEETLTPEVVMDAAALTEVRTPAVAVAGVLDRLRASSEPLECVIVGAGVQGRAHARTIVDVLAGVREVSVTFISRSEPADLPYPWAESGSAAADEVLGRAGLVVVATSAGEPVVVDRQLRADATVLAVGAHTADTRELHEDVLRGAQVLVEDVEAARREAGDVAIAVEKGALAWEDAATMAEVVRGDVALDPARRVVFKTVGMPWEDLAVARVVASQAPAALK
ncbi:ornithine cyclodeaminase family protein [Corynebacterium lehmanniae]|uniref:ornithine cyclodeaminase family protein n=1 Tax=Corynebacterium haemomassiliense TaxID=2754726 RepID=UPI00370D48FB